jgi:hypothetical protein
MKNINLSSILLCILLISGCMVSTDFDEESKRTLTIEEACGDMCSESDVINTSKSVSNNDFWTHAFLSWLPYSIYFAYYGLGLIIGIFVYRDASQRNTLAFNIKPFWWGTIVFLEPPLGVLCYWVIHYSTLSDKSNEKEDQ